METIQPLNAQLKHRQAKEHSNARLMQRSQLQSLKRYQTLLL
jgi:hypothetical protein